MIRKSLNFMQLLWSQPKLINLDYQEYFPLKNDYRCEYTGTYSSNEENFSFSVLIENIEDNVLVIGKEASRQCKFFFDDSGNEILRDEVYFAYNENKVIELGRVRDDILNLHDVPVTYLQSIEKGKASNNVYFNKSFATVDVCGVEMPCLLVRKEFFDNNKLIRIETLYLVKNLGLVKYEEKSIHPRKFHLSFHKRRNKIGYRFFHNELFGNMLFNPKLKIIQGKVKSSQHDSFINIAIQTSTMNIDQVLSNATDMYHSFQNYQNDIRLQIANEISENYHSLLGNEKIDLQVLASKLLITDLQFRNEQELLISCIDSDFLDGFEIIAEVDQGGRVLHVDFV